MGALPQPQYTQRNGARPPPRTVSPPPPQRPRVTAGALNLASSLPTYTLPPDLGPKMYVAYGAVHGAAGALGRLQTALGMPAESRGVVRRRVRHDMSPRGHVRRRQRVRARRAGQQRRHGRCAARLADHITAGGRRRLAAQIAAEVAEQMSERLANALLCEAPAGVSRGEPTEPRRGVRVRRGGASVARGGGKRRGRGVGHLRCRGCRAALRLPLEGAPCHAP